MVLVKCHLLHLMRKYIMTNVVIVKNKPIIIRESYYKVHYSHTL